MATHSATLCATLVFLFPRREVPAEPVSSECAFATLYAQKRTESLMDHGVNPTDAIA